MEKTFPSLEEFLLSDEDRKSLESQFKLIMANANLVEMRKDEVIKKIKEAVAPNVSGVYFCLMDIGEFRYKLYIGKAKSLERRVGDYMNHFQPHSPNDFKIRVFQQYVLDREPTARFPLYFMPTLEHTTKETEMIKNYKRPMLNRRAKPGEAARRAFRDAFVDYYRAGFDHLLAK